MRNFISKKIVYSILMICLSGCYYNTRLQDPVVDPAFDSVETMQLMNNYKSIQQNILQARCLNCHSEAGGNKGQLNLETYSSIKKNLNQIAFRSLEKRDMPEGGLPEGEYALLKMWIESGAPEKNTENDLNPVITGPLDWTTIQGKILTQRCLDCHSGGQPEANLNLTDYDQFKSKAVQIMDRVLVKQDMPPEPYPALTAQQKSALIKWISQGFSK